MTWIKHSKLEELGYKIKGDPNLVFIDDRAIINCYSLTIGENTRIDALSFISGVVEIGRNVHVSPFCILSGKNCINIGDFCTISGGVKMYTSNADYSKNPGGLTNPTIPNKFKSWYGAPITLEKHVMVGADALILPNNVLYEGCVIGAKTIVPTKYYPKAWTRYAGVKIKPIGYRRKDKVLESEKALIDAENKDPDFWNKFWFY